MSEFSDKIKTIGYLSKGRSRPREVSGREHPDSGKPFKSVTDENGTVITEHSNPGSGVSCRQDAEVHPQTVQVIT